LDSVLVALLYNPTPFVIDHVVGGTWPSSSARPSLATAEVLDRLQTTLAVLATGLAGREAQPDPTGAVEIVRKLLGTCRFASDFSSGRQQDASEALYALLELRNLHTGVGSLEITVVLDNLETTRRTESASVVLSVHTWDTSWSMVHTLDQSTATILDPPHTVGGRLVRRLATRMVYTPAGYFVVHFDRTTAGRKRVPVDDSVRVADGRTFRLHAAVLHHGSSLSTGHYTAVVRHAGGGWLHYNDVAREHPVRQTLDAIPGLRESAVLLMYTEDDTTNRCKHLHR
jgi:hypothetical protein